MKIALFTDSYKPYLSGVTNSAEILVNELRRMGHRVYVFAPRYPNYIDTDPDVIRFPSLPSGYPKFRLALPYVNRIPEVDIVHSYTPFQVGLMARYVARRKRLPLVYSFHTLFTRYVHYARVIPEPLSKLGMVTYLRSFCQGADLVITPSEMARRVLRAWKIRQPIEVIPSGVEQHLFSQSPDDARLNMKRKLGIPEGDKVLLYAGRLSKEKNLSFLIKAFKKLERDNVYLLLIGGGPMEKELRRHSSPKIILAGEINYPEVLNYYPAGDIFVFSSLTETQGMVLAEAKTAGLPVVALFAGGLADTVRNGVDGYLVRRNMACFVEHIKHLLDDAFLREKMSLAARVDARERFSSPVVAKKVESVYNFLVNRKEQT